MSISITGYVMDVSDELPNKESFLVLLILGNWSDDNGLSWYSVKKIADKCKMSRNTVKKYLYELEAAGNLRIIRSDDGNHGNMYQVITHKTPTLKANITIRDVLEYTRARSIEQRYDLVKWCIFEDKDGVKSRPRTGSNLDPLRGQTSAPRGSSLGGGGGQPVDPEYVSNLKESVREEIKADHVPSKCEKGDTIGAVILVVKSHTSFRNVSTMTLEQVFRSYPADKWPEAVNSLLEDFAGVSITKPVGRLKNYLRGRDAFYGGKKEDKGFTYQEPVNTKYHRLVSEMVEEAKREPLAENRMDWLEKMRAFHQGEVTLAGKTVVDRAVAILTAEGFLPEAILKAS